MEMSQQLHMYRPCRHSDRQDFTGFHDTLHATQQLTEFIYNSRNSTLTLTDCARGLRTQSISILLYIKQSKKLQNKAKYTGKYIKYVI